MNICYRVKLSEAERTELQVMLSGGRHAVRRLKRAQILLATDAGQSDEAIATSVAVSASTVRRTKRRFVEGNLDARSARSPGRVLGASSRARRRRCWSPPPVPIRPKGAPAGRSNSWPANWCA